ncbi:maleate cis-trans isomerase [Mycobacterium vulneris]|uniref:maleate cis-trans isomerase family protein n=1 Tax=Mycolicibacterium porcinum TaxID=39693 RepID=UPI00080AD83A|nr:maleate cis-trans isomerase [Mycolicibacterium porcinum]OCB11838.1 maleate cis-trans isomerase [Mycolicibacterium porcinum]OCB54057.1 maleate cis-trans isomerase [Mycolicibacterium vulneris]OCB64729.1 maleate cis-trans isomerase [Mycolicibacterium vulneris]
MATVGILYPGHSAEDDFDALQARLPETLKLPVAITSVGEDAHRVDALLDLGRTERLADGVVRLRTARPDSMMWACTSGSFVFGRDGARRQADEVAAASGVPASSTSIAFVDALQHLGIHRVAVAASYPEDVAAHFVAFLATGGVDVVSMGSHGIVTAAEVGRLEQEQVLAMVTAADHSDAEAVLVPDTAMHTMSFIDQLESAVGKPVLTANQVTVWKGLQLIGPVPSLPGLGRLFGARP